MHLYNLLIIEKKLPFFILNKIQQRMHFQGETVFYFCNQPDFFLLLLWKHNTFDKKNVVHIMIKSRMSSAMYILFFGPPIINVFWPPP